MLEIGKPLPCRSPFEVFDENLQAMAVGSPPQILIDVVKGSYDRLPTSRIFLGR